MRIPGINILMFFLLLSGPGFATAAAPSPDLLETGRQYYRSGEYDRAYDQFFTLFKDSPGDLELNFLLGRAALAKKDYEAAVMAFERVLIIDPAETAVKVELGKAFFYLGNVEMANRFFREALQAELPAGVRGNLEEFLDAIKGKDDGGQ